MACGNIEFSGLYPMLNDRTFPGLLPDLKVRQSGCYLLIYRLNRYEAEYFVIEISTGNDRVMIRYYLEGCAKPQLINKFGIYFKCVTGVSTFLKNGYYSWDGSIYLGEESLENGGQYESFSMTQLMSEDHENILTIGFDRHDRYQQCFVHKKTNENRSIQSITYWDRKATGDQALSSELIQVYETESVEQGLRKWAKMVAENAPIKPRIPDKRVIGWCSWYNLYASINEENLLENLTAVVKTRDREMIPLEVFLIDDGFTPEMGDWLEFKPQFPSGIAPIIQKIKDAGLIPGLWIAPFLVGNRSKLFQKHPEWVVKDKSTGLPFACMRFFGEFRWHKRSEEYYLLDITYPPAAEYLFDVLRTWHDEWGVEYFKTDFLYLAAENGPDKVSYHEPGFTRIDFFRKGCELIRDAIREAFLAGCGVPLWAAVGIFDSVRIGRDTGVEWMPANLIKSPLETIPNRSYINGILYQTDPDCVLLRDKFHYFNDKEVDALCALAGLTGGTLMTSDKMDEIPPTRMDRFKKISLLNNEPGYFLNLGNPRDPLIIQVRKNQNSGLSEHFFLLNTSDKPLFRSVPIQNLGLISGKSLICVDSKSDFFLDQGFFKVQLAPHESRWFLVKDTK